MAERRDERRGGTGTTGGTDVEPLRGGMEEEERGRAGPGPATGDDPPAPYHGTAVAPGGLAPRGEPAHEGGSTPREGAPPEPGTAGESAAHPGEKAAQERGELEREGGNARRS